MRTPVVLPLVVALGLSACASTNPGDGASIRYHLPRTDVKATLDLVLKSCNGKPSVEGSLTLDPVAGVQDDVTYRISGSALASWKIKRTMKVTLSDSGVLTGINSENTDQTAAIAGSVVKIVATVATVAAMVAPDSAGGSAPGETHDKLECTEDTALASARSIKLKEEIKKQKGVVATALDSGGFPTAEVRKLNSLAKEYVALNSDDGPLHLKVTKTIRLNTPPSSVGGTTDVKVDMDVDSFRKWFGPKDSATKSHAWIQKRQDLLQGAFGLTGTANRKNLPISDVTIVGDPTSTRTCELSVWTPNVTDVEIVLNSGDKAYMQPVDAKKSVPVAQ